MNSGGVAVIAAGKAGGGMDPLPVLILLFMIPVCVGLGYLLSVLYEKYQTKRKGGQNDNQTNR